MRANVPIAPVLATPLIFTPQGTCSQICFSCFSVFIGIWKHVKKNFRFPLSFTTIYDDLVILLKKFKSFPVFLFPVQMYFVLRQLLTWISLILEENTPLCIVYLTWLLSTFFCTNIIFFRFENKLCYWTNLFSKMFFLFTRALLNFVLKLVGRCYLF